MVSQIIASSATGKRPGKIALGPLIVGSIVGFLGMRALRIVLIWFVAGRIAGIY